MNPDFPPRKTTRDDLTEAFEEDLEPVARPEAPVLALVSAASAAQFDQFRSGVLTEADRIGERAIVWQVRTPQELRQHCRGNKKLRIYVLPGAPMGIKDSKFMNVCKEHGISVFKVTASKMQEFE